jgi:hypothetical protein
MNNINPNELINGKTKATKKRLRLCVILTTLVLFGLSCFLLSPLYVSLSSNVLYSGGFVTGLINFINNTFYIAVYAVCFSAFIYSVDKLGTKHSFALVVTYCVAVLLRYIANVIVQTFLDGVFPSFRELSPAIWGCLFDILIALAVILIAHLCFKNIGKNKAKNACLPFEKLYESSNPLQKASLLTGILLASIKVLTRVIYDIGYGAPTSILDLLRMIVYYISDVLICVIIYLASLLLIMYFDKKNN